MSAHYFGNRKMLIKEDSITPAHASNSKTRLLVRPLSPFISFRFPSCSLSGVEKLLAPYIQNKRLSESGPRAPKRCDLRASTGDAIKQRIYRGRCARRLKEEKTRKRKRKRAIGLTSGSPQGVRWQSGKEKSPSKQCIARNGCNVRGKGIRLLRSIGRNQHRTHSAKTPSLCDGSDTAKSPPPQFIEKAPQTVDLRVSSGRFIPRLILNLLLIGKAWGHSCYLNLPGHDKRGKF
jgi:hypothetical protein